MSGSLFVRLLVKFRAGSHAVLFGGKSKPGSSDMFHGRVRSVLQSWPHLSLARSLVASTRNMRHVLVDHQDPCTPVPRLSQHMYQDVYPRTGLARTLFAAKRLAQFLSGSSFFRRNIVRYDTVGLSGHFGYPRRRVPRALPVMNPGSGRFDPQRGWWDKLTGVSEGIGWNKRFLFRGRSKQNRS